MTDTTDLLKIVVDSSIKLLKDTAKLLSETSLEEDQKKVFRNQMEEISAVCRHYRKNF